MDGIEVKVVVRMTGVDRLRRAGLDGEDSVTWWIRRLAGGLGYLRLGGRVVCGTIETRSGREGLEDGCNDETGIQVKLF